MSDIEGEFVALLAEHPVARVAVLAVDGAPAEVPDSLRVDPARMLTGGRALPLMLAEDRVAIIDAWSKMLEFGTCTIDARFTQRPDVVVHSWYFDLREAHGVCAVVLVPSDPEMDFGLIRAEPRVEPPPRLARMTKDQFATVLTIDESTTRMLGWTSDDLVGQSGLELVHPDDHEAAITAWFDMLDSPGHSYGAQQRYRHKDGRWVWVQTVNHNGLGLDEGCVRTDIIDISDEMAALEALRDRERLLNRLAEALPVGIVQVDSDGRTTYGNNRLIQILGRNPVGDVLTPDNFGVHPDDGGRLTGALRSVLTDGRGVDVELRLGHGPSGTERRVNIAFRSLVDDDTSTAGAIATVEDVTESVHMRLELERRATLDQLTGCLNRASVLEELDAAILRLGPGDGLAVVFLDLDGFKEINDGWGHATGDEVLAALAGRLTARTRPKDLVGRIGGDEFLVVCPGVADADTARAIAEAVRGAVSGPIALPEGTIRQQVSVGVAWTGEHVPADALVARADQAMYASKRSSRGGPVRAPVDGDR